MRIAFFARQPHEDEHIPIFRQMEPSFDDSPLDAEQTRCVHIEISVHGIERDDGGQQRRILVDEVAARHVVTADLAVDRRRDTREFEVELVDLRAGLGGIESGLRLVYRGLVLIELLLADAVGDGGGDGLVAGQRGLASLSDASLSVT